MLLHFGDETPRGGKPVSRPPTDAGNVDDYDNYTTTTNQLLGFYS